MNASPSLFDFDKTFEDLKESFGLEELDDWKTTAALAELTINKIRSRMPHWDAHLFAFTSEYREYRELDSEGISSIPEDSLFIACLAMRDEGLPVKELFAEYQLDDPLLEQLLVELYKARWVQPVVHRFRLLGFILLCSDNTEHLPDEKERGFMGELSRRLKTNLYAASVADERQRNLLELAEFPSRLRAKHNAVELLDTMLDELGRDVPFDIAVYYSFNEFDKTLIPRSWRGLASRPRDLALGSGISGMTLDRMRAIAVPDRSRHPSFAVMDEEPFIKGSFVSCPLATDRRKFGVITLVRNEDNSEDYGVEQRYTLEIAASFIASELDSRQLYDELERSYFSTITSLTRALEAKDEYTKGHSERVMNYAVGIARTLSLSPDLVRQIRYAAILHDIGKIGISDLIINKPEKLTDEEFVQIKRHTEIGYEIVDESGFLAEIRDLIRYHHEKIDGTGYYGKSAGNYPWEAMIISIADIYDALTSDRPYRKAMDTVDALQSLTTLVGVHFDRRIFSAFCTHLGVNAEVLFALQEQVVYPEESINTGKEEDSRTL